MLGIPERRFGDDIRTYLKERRCAVYCSHLAQKIFQRRYVLNTVMNVWVPEKEGIF
jgi:hypothetical protein